MPTVEVDHSPNVVKSVLVHLADNLPDIVAPEMNISGRQLHDGGVGLREIMVKFREQSEFDRNINAIQITVYAHNFEARVTRHEEIKDAIIAGVKRALDFVHFTDTVGVAVRLEPIEYGTINKEDS